MANKKVSSLTELTVVANDDELAIIDTSASKSKRISRLNLLDLKDEDNMVSDSATAVASQQSIKKYVDDQILTEDTLEELNDTTITAISDNELLQYDTGTSKWINQTLAEAGIQPLDTALTNISGLTYASASFIKLTAEDTYAVRTLAQTMTDLSGAATAAFSFNSQNLTSMGTIGCGAITTSGKLTVNQGSNINSIRAEHSGTNSSGIVLIGNSLTEAAGHYTSTSNAGFVATSGLIHGYVSNVSASGKVAVFKQVGTGDTLFLDTNGNAKSLNIGSEATSATVINVTAENTSGNIMNIDSKLIMDYAGKVGIGLTPTANMNGLSVEAGLLTLKETTTPTADVNYGKIYTKADNKLYFQTGAGTEKELGGMDGWSLAGESWSYASATTITVPAGAASKYQKGDKLKFTQSTDGVKYMYVIGTADTVLTVTGGLDYDLDNEAITSPYYSKADTPQGFPTTFAYAGTLTQGAGTNPTYTLYDMWRFSMSGNVVSVSICLINTSDGTAGSGANQIYLSAPITSKNINTRWIANSICKNGGNSIQGYGWLFPNSKNIELYDYLGSTITQTEQNSAARGLTVSLQYEI